AGAGVRLPWRFVTPATVRLAVERALDDASITARARELEAWAAEHDAAGRASELVEDFAAQAAAN
ncbi:MAG: hypothetical protein QOJ12_2988, partial [Thermoleophilales bacterium]|nr:hypothetical protein [Thermoleophilales bacterium]